MIKRAIQNLCHRLGYHLSSTDHLGVAVELDLARLTAYDPLRNIFDVGGNFGQTAVRFARAFPDATIFTFEPVPDSFARLQKAVRPHARVYPFNLALGDRSGTLAMSVGADAGRNTLRPTGATDAASVEVHVDTVDAQISAQGVRTLDLLKIDVEGYELPVLQGAEQAFHRGAVRFVFAECVLPCDTVDAHTSFFDLHRVLVGHGFCFVAYYGEAFRLSDGCALGNVLYALQSKLPSRASGRILNVA